MAPVRISVAARRVLLPLVLAGTSCLGACSWLENQYSNDPAFSEKTQGGQISTPGAGPTFDLNSDCIPAQRDGNGQCTGPKNNDGQCAGPKSTLARIDCLGTSEDAALLRDRLQDYLLMRSDQMCERHRSGILSTQSVANFSMNTITTGLTATAAIVVAPATNILAALGAITTGTRSAFNADIYQKFVGPAIVKKTSDLRAETLRDILGKRTKQPADAKQKPEIVSVKSYTPEAAVADVERYNQYCSFAWGLALLSDTIPKYADTAAGIQKRIDVLRKQQLDNQEQMKQLAAANPDATGRLKDVNNDISRQIMILQHQMLTAPQAIDPKSGTD